MTEHSPTAGFHAATFLHGANADYIDALQARYAEDPGSVDASWLEFFQGLAEPQRNAARAANGPSCARADWPPAPADEPTAALGVAQLEGALRRLLT